MTASINLWKDRELRIQDTAEDLDVEFIYDTPEGMVERLESPNYKNGSIQVYNATEGCLSTQWVNCYYCNESS